MLSVFLGDDRVKNIARPSTQGQTIRPIRAADYVGSFNMAVSSAVIDRLYKDIIAASSVTGYAREWCEFADGRKEDGRDEQKEKDDDVAPEKVRS